MRIALIINPKAGTKGSKESLIRNFHRLAKDTVPDSSFEILTTKYAGHAIELAAKVSKEGFDLCIAAGGDGTMNEVARSLMGTKTALGIVPLGSGNGLARHLKIPLNTEKAFLQLLKGKNEKMDAGRANGMPFFLASGFGFEGVVSHRFANKKTRGFLQYIVSSIESFNQYKPIEISGTCDGTAFQSKIFTATLANGSEYGNGAKIAPGAQIDDGLLQFIRILPFPLWSAVGLFLKLMIGRLRSSHFYCNSPFSNLIIKSEIPLLGHVDGEPVLFGNELTIEIEPGCLLIRKPPSS